jgi:hypothetical protein
VQRQGRVNPLASYRHRVTRYVALLLCLQMAEPVGSQISVPASGSGTCISRSVFHCTPFVGEARQEREENCARIDLPAAILYYVEALARTLG